MSFAHGDVKNSLTNREEFLRPLGIDYRDLTCASQVHADTIALVSLKDKGRGALSKDSGISCG